MSSCILTDRPGDCICLLSGHGGGNSNFQQNLVICWATVCGKLLAADNTIGASKEDGQGTGWAGLGW